MLKNDNLEFRYLVTEEFQNERIDKCINELIDTMSRSYIQKMVKEEQITVNEKVIKSNYRLKINDEIFFYIPESIVPDIEAEDIPLAILYEDKDVIIVNKEKDMVVHPAPGHYTGTLVNALMHHCKDELSGINGVMRPGIVHRIDKDTTGSIIVCKNDNAHSSIAKQLKEHTLKRKYRALVYGVIDEDGTIDAPIGRDVKNRRKMIITNRNSKEAVTHYKVLQTFDKYTYIECQLETGRTHQIRVHMASINHPILGDDIYGARKSPFKLQGQTLHAMTLGFEHPSTEIYMEIEAPLPEYFLKLLEILK